MDQRLFEATGGAEVPAGNNGTVVRAAGGIGILGRTIPCSTLGRMAGYGDLHRLAPLLPPRRESCWIGPPTHTLKLHGHLGGRVPPLEGLPCTQTVY
jgi:hypothetical protein